MKTIQGELEFMIGNSSGEKRSDIAMKTESRIKSEVEDRVAVVEIDDKVKELKDLTDKDEIVECLQSIGEIFVTSAMFKARLKSEEYYIYPLLVEAYYYKEGVFMDNSSYCREEQAGHQYEYYPHAGRRISRGIDIVLSDSNDYYLSYLLKCVLIVDTNTKNAEPELLNQTEFYRKFKDEFERESHSIILNAEDENIRTNTVVLSNVRRGLKEECPYARKHLAIVAIDRYKNDEKYMKQYKKLRNSLYSKTSADDGFGGGVEGLVLRNVDYLEDKDLCYKEITGYRMSRYPEKDGGDA
jgi:hypothetical protein